MSFLQNRTDFTKFEAVIFDLDNTLYPEADYRSCAYLEIAGFLAEKLELKQENLFNKMDSLYNKYGDRYLFQHLLEYCGITGELQKKYISNHLVPIYRNCDCDLTLYKDALEILEYLERKNYKTGLITNGGPETQWNKINLLGIEKYFDQIIVTGEHWPQKNWKPDIKPFKLCFDKLKVKPENSLYTGDKKDVDIKGAQKAGCLGILIDRDLQDGRKMIDSDYLMINNLTEIIDVISKGENK